MKVMFLMRSMAVGGAQRQLCVLCDELQRRGHEVSVLLYYTGEPLDEALHQLGVRVIDLKKRGRWRNVGFLTRLLRTVRTEQPDVLYAQLPVSNLLALLFRYMHGRIAIACGVRASDMTAAKSNWLARLTLQLERLLVLRADVVIVNSRVGARYLVGGGRHENVVVIDNGIEAQRFAFDEEGRRLMRTAWRAGVDTRIIGCVARLDPMKDHETLLRAFAQVRQARADTRLICVGTMPAAYSAHLRRLATDLQLEQAVLWISHEPRLRELYSGFDVLCLSSAYGEGFPNVLAEGMACGLPCVATDIGDAGRIVSNADFLVPPVDPDSLARALTQALDQGRAFSQPRIEKIRREFSPALLAERTEQALQAALRRRDARMAWGGIR